MNDYKDPYFLERLEEAQEKARKLIYEPENDNETVINILKMTICRHLRMGFFDKYFESRTLDELCFEAFMYKFFDEKMYNTRPENSNKATSDILNSNKEELKGMFNDFKEIDGISDQQALEQARKEFAAMDLARREAQKK